MKQRFIKLISFLLGFLIKRKFKNIFRLKDSINNSTGFKKDLLLNLYYLELEKLNSWIGYDTIFMDIPLFPHGISGIFISREAKIGSNCTIFHQVTIGSNTLQDSNFGSPVIGDNVYIGAGAKIIGDISIGDNCRIGANAVVYKNMPPNSLAVNSPTRIIIRTETMDNRFYTLREDDKGNKKWYYYNAGKWYKKEE